METLEARREEFRSYLEKSGVIDALSKALIKLYEESDKPTNAVRYVRKYMCESCPDDEEYEKLLTSYNTASEKVTTLEKEIAQINTQKALKTGFQLLQDDSESESLLKKYLTFEIFEALEEKSTSFGSTLYDCVKSGFDNHDSGVGIYAADREAYTVFADIFDPIIADYHNGFLKESIHPDLDFGDPSTLENLDPDNEFIISTRVRCARSIEGYAFHPRLEEKNYEELMTTIKTALETLDGELEGAFHPLTEMDPIFQQQMIDEHFLFKEGDRFLESAGASKFWPVGRGIFFNETKTFLVWCNEEDHLRIISMEKSGDLGKIYERMVAGVKKLGETIPFARDDRLGYLTFCPSNLGTTIRASVHIKLPKLSADQEELEAVAAKYNLQVRGTRGEHSESEDGVYDISNKRRLGLTEYEAVKEMHDGIAELINNEKTRE